MNEEKLPNIDDDVVVLPDLSNPMSFADMDRDGIVLADSTTPLHEEIKIVCILGEPKHAKEIKKVKDDFVKKGYVVITEPYDVDITDGDFNCIKESIFQSIRVANFIYVVNIDGIDPITENYITFAKMLNKSIAYHLQKEIDLSTYFTINKNRVIEEVNDTYSNLIRTTKAIEPIIGKMVELSDEAYMDYSGNRYTGKQPMIHSTCSIIGPVTNIVWNGYTFNIATNNERINGVTQHFVKFVISYPDCNLYGIPKTATLHVKIDEHKYSSSMDVPSDPEIELTVCKIFNTVIKEFNAIGEKIDETAD